MKNEDREIQAELERDIDASTVAVDEIVRQVNRSLFIDTATSFVTGKLEKFYTIYYL